VRIKREQGRATNVVRFLQDVSVTPERMMPSSMISIRRFF
jgi:hypothetical protein